MEMVDHFLKDWFTEEHSIYRFYVICFSEEDDLLSQWRGYSDDASGVSIGFDSEILEQLTDTGYIIFNSVSYDTEQHSGLVRDKAHNLIEDLKKVVQEKPSDIKQTSMHAFDAFSRKVFRISPFLKSPFFEEEKEHRLVLWDRKNELTSAKKSLPGGFKLDDLHYLCRDGRLCGYADLSFAGVDSLVKEVTLGPRCKSTKYAVEEFLNYNGLNDVNVNISRGTYR